jgi:hypothetical protein
MVAVCCIWTALSIAVGVGTTGEVCGVLLVQVTIITAVMRINTVIKEFFIYNLSFPFPLFGCLYPYLLRQQIKKNVPKK